MQYIESLPGLKGEKVTIKGWVHNKRKGKGIVFLVLRDGTGFCQIVISESDTGVNAHDLARTIPQESALEINGKVVSNDREYLGVEVQADEILLIHQAEESYPITNKPHGIDFLMDNRHLWLRTRSQWAVLRVRNKVIHAIHEFFQSRGFVHTDTPIFTGSAAEGTTTLFETDFYGEPAYLAQTGQLYGEALAMALGRIYTFGPTFRAEKSKTRRHLSEFWMIEPEMAFYDNEQNMDLIEAFIREVVLKVKESCDQELKVLGRDVSMLERVKSPFPRLTYDEAVRILRGEKDVKGENAIATLENDLKEVKKSIKEKEEEIREREENIAKGGMKKGAINFNRNKIDQLKNDIREDEERAANIPVWLKSARNFKHGNDFGGSDETVLTRLFDTPVMVYNWPKGIKAFYMKRVEDNDEYVKGVDVLAPEGFGEIVGGSERESSKELLIKRIKEEGLPMEAFEWYLDLRRFGSVPHAGFGLGLERFITWICNLDHLRETIPFPRLYGRLFP